MPFGDVRIDLVLVEDAGLLVFLEHRAVGVDAPHLMAGFCSFRKRPAPQIVPPVPTPDDQVGDASVGLVPDLRAGLLVVRREFERLSYWLAFHAFGRLALEARRHRVVRARIFRIDVGRADDDFGAEGAKRIDLFLRLFVGRGEDALVALDDRGDRQAHAGVAGRALDDRAAGLELPVRSASSIILSAMRSLIELPGLNVSILASTVGARSGPR